MTCDFSDFSVLPALIRSLGLPAVRRPGFRRSGGRPRSDQRSGGRVLSGHRPGDLFADLFGDHSGDLFRVGQGARGDPVSVSVAVAVAEEAAQARPI
ncbi:MULTISPECIES: hypothetical protein [unclassified Streptomyces]|uniref:hypothetical protein n=1 Tax=unclassified Streptomyces TaxID=2593676 RepID=UPI000361BE38|nr:MULTISPECIES: hypothetical protein [unclassified Streptomyces]EYT84656.1 hypothetical protein CF54_00305 [Streptomyces sp. Tu 6176]